MPKVNQQFKNLIARRAITQSEVDALKKDLAIATERVNKNKDLVKHIRGVNDMHYEVFIMRGAAARYDTQHSPDQWNKESYTARHYKIINVTKYEETRDILEALLKQERKQAYAEKQSMIQYDEIAKQMPL